MVYRPTYRDKKTGKAKRQAVWWIQYSIGGKRQRESTGTTVHSEAVRFLTRRLNERGRGVSRRDLEKVTFEDLEALILADYKKNQRRSTDRLQRSLKYLRSAFGGWRVVDIGEDGIDRYAVARLGEDAAHATVNRELAALRRMFRLGARARIVGHVPAFDLLTEDNVRTGFLEETEFAALLCNLPDYLQPLAVAGYVTGWRKSELLSRDWRHVDFKAGWIRLDPGETKNREGRQFPLIPRLREALEQHAEHRREVERTTGQIVNAVFFRYKTGAPIKSFRKAWARACVAAGVPGLFFHDLRRTAARNLIRAGIAEKIAMDLTGHRTRSVFDRYAIVDEILLAEQTEKLTQHYEKMAAEPERKVVPLNG
jgi:integrase